MAFTRWARGVEGTRHGRGSCCMSCSEQLSNDSLNDSGAADPPAVTVSIDGHICGLTNSPMAFSTWAWFEPDALFGEIA